MTTRNILIGAILFLALFFLWAMTSCATKEKPYMESKYFLGRDGQKHYYTVRSGE